MHFGMLFAVVRRESTRQTDSLIMMTGLSNSPGSLGTIGCNGSQTGPTHATDLVRKTTALLRFTVCCASFLGVATFAFADFDQTNADRHALTTVPPEVNVNSLDPEPLASSSREERFRLKQKEDRVVIAYAGHPVAEYVFRDERILRPYLANLHAPGGLKVTRNHPPQPGTDATDHETMHPGVWLAFGDINGQDFWRNKAVIRHHQFSEPATVQDHRITFSTENRLQSVDGQTLGLQRSRITVTVRPAGYLLVWESVFTPEEQELIFGDQEEMGLGVRVARFITEKNGGFLVASSGATGAKATWGKAFDWCNYSGVIAGRRAGVMLMPDPANFRPSWFHNRDYGLMVANPFGRKAMGQGELSRVVVKKGEQLTLRFGILLHATPAEAPIDLPAAYRDFLDLLRE